MASRAAPAGVGWASANGGGPRGSSRTYHLPEQGWGDRHWAVKRWEHITANLQQLQASLPDALSALQGVSRIGASNAGAATAEEIETPIPRIIHVYWEGALNPFAEACIRLMRQHNPGWTLNRLPEGAPGHLDPPPAMLAAEFRSDWMRVDALAKWGGVYLDATNVILAPIEQWVNLSSNAVQGFDTGSTAECTSRPPQAVSGVLSGALDRTSGCIRSMDNFAIAAPRSHPLIAAWQQQLRLAFWCGHRCMETYSSTLRSTGLLSADLRASLPYMTANAAFVAAVALTPGAPVHLTRSYMPGGPLEWALHSGRVKHSPQLAVQMLFNLSEAQLSLTPFLKFAHFHRPYIPFPEDPIVKQSWLLGQVWNQPCSHGHDQHATVMPASIPKRIHQTTNLQQPTPLLLGNYSNSYSVRLARDADLTLDFNACEKVFPGVVLAAARMKEGAHRADLWRYCQLWVHGGVYMDIKTVPTQVIEDTFAVHDQAMTSKPVWFVVMTVCHGAHDCWGQTRLKSPMVARTRGSCSALANRRLYNGVIATPPSNPLIADFIRYVIEHSPPEFGYHEYILDATSRLCAEFNLTRQSPIGGTFESPRQRMVVFEERCGLANSSECRKVPCQRTDRYGLCCNIYDTRSHPPSLVMHTRDPAYKQRVPVDGETEVRSECHA